MIRNTPMHRMGTPEEVAAAVLFLAGPSPPSSPGSISWSTVGAASFLKESVMSEAQQTRP